MWYVPITTGNLLVTKRTLDELKREVQRRADRNLPPVAGIDPADARAVLAGIGGLERDEWAQAWSAAADRHLERAVELEPADPQQGGREYWQAWRLFNFARWPVENTPFKRYTYPRALAAFRNYGRLMDPPLELVRIPFENEVIVGYLRVPRAPRPAPLVLGISGLDSRKEDVMAYGDAYLARGIALFALDLPGTGEAPARLEAKADRLFSAALDHLARRDDVDAGRLVVQGRSWSGYWATKLAHTERSRICGAVMHGGPVHHYFQRDWLLPSLDSPEYLYDYLPAKAALFGAGNADELFELAPRCSLLTLGVLDLPCAPMLLVNGARDSQIPISDLHLLRSRCPSHDAWINPDGGHMGRSTDWPAKRIFDEVLMPWIVRRLNAPA